MYRRTIALLASSLLVVAYVLGGCSNNPNEDCTGVGGYCVASCDQGSLPYSCNGGNVCCQENSTSPAPTTTSTPPEDAGTGTEDTGTTTPVESGTGPVDTGTAPADTGTTPAESGTGATDSGAG